jgi:hypothetical protein
MTTIEKKIGGGRGKANEKEINKLRRSTEKTVSKYNSGEERKKRLKPKERQG